MNAYDEDNRVEADRCSMGLCGYGPVEYVDVGEQSDFFDNDNLLSRIVTQFQLHNVLCYHSSNLLYYYSSKYIVAHVLRIFV